MDRSTGNTYNVSKEQNTPGIERRRFRPYPEYKDSGVEGLGNIPEHWKILALKRICRLAYGDSLAADERRDGDFEVYGSNGPVGVHDRSNSLGPCLVVGRKGSFGKINFSPNPVFAIDTTFFIDSRFTSVYLRWLYFALTGLHLDSISKDSAIPGLDREDAYARLVPVCSVEEQREVASFLDRETAKIDALIEKKHWLIELLQEKRTALITQAVTKGLDPTVPMKYSGIEWLGKIPAHWEVLSLKRLGIIQAGAGFPDDEQGMVDEDLPFFKVGDLARSKDGKHLDIAPNSISKDTAKRLRAYVFPAGTIVFAKVGAALKLNRRRILTRPACIDNNMMGFITDRCDRDWAFCLLCSLDLGELANPGAVPSVNEGQAREIQAALPPIEEQRAIGSFHDREAAKIDALISKIREAITSLSEYRTALISAAVTGKMDVREVQ